MLGVTFYIIGIVKGFSSVESQPTKVQVYVNDNDSVVEQLQKDVTNLTKIVEKIDTGSVVMEVKRVREKQ